MPALPCGRPTHPTGADQSSAIVCRSALPIRFCRRSTFITRAYSPWLLSFSFAPGCHAALCRLHNISPRFGCSLTVLPWHQRLHATSLPAHPTVLLQLRIDAAVGLRAEQILGETTSMSSGALRISLSGRTLALLAATKLVHSALALQVLRRRS